MNAAKRRRTEARQYLRSWTGVLALGGRPSPEDIEAAGLTAHAADIRKVARLIHAHREQGEYGRGRELARELAEALLVDLGPDWSPPRDGPDYESMSADELAALVWRR